MTVATFKDLRDFITTTPIGQVTDSLLAVELGLDKYRAFWDAHRDFNHHQNNFDDNDIVVTFLVEVGELVGFSEVDFDKILGVEV